MERRGHFRPWTMGRRPRRCAHAQAWLESTRAALRPLHRRRLGGGPRRVVRQFNPATGERIGATLARPARPTWTRRSRGAAGAGPGAPAAPVRARYLYALAARYRSIRACSPCWRRWTTASRSARAATSISRWSPATSIIMPAGRSCWTAEFPSRTRSACGADHPLELPAADAGLEDRAGAGRGQYRGAQAGGVHPL